VLVRHGSEEIDGADNPDEGCAPENREAANAMLYHELRRLIGPHIRGHRENLSGHDVRYLHLGSPGPESLLLFQYGEGRGEQQAEIPIAEHPDKPLFLNDREVADVMAPEHVKGVPKAILGPDRYGFCGHVAFHRHLPLLTRQRAPRATLTRTYQALP
jgi:hypothetical protein